MIRELVEPSPAELRARVDAIPDAPIRTPRNGEVDGRLLRHLDMACVQAGFRISEIVTKRYPSDSGRNTSSTLSLRTETHIETGEEALVYKFNVLKRKAPIIRDSPRPLRAALDPWSSKVLSYWQEHNSVNPFSITRQAAWDANRIVFSGFGYAIEPYYLKYLKPTPRTIIGQGGIKPFNDHAMRHACDAELKDWYQAPDDFMMAYFKWAPAYLGFNPSAKRYERTTWSQLFRPLTMKPAPGA